MITQTVPRNGRAARAAPALLQISKGQKAKLPAEASEINKVLSDLPKDGWDLLTRQWNKARDPESILLAIEDEIPILAGLVAALALARESDQHSQAERLGLTALSRHIEDHLSRIGSLIGTVRGRITMEEAIGALPQTDAGYLHREGLGEASPEDIRRAVLNEFELLCGYAGVIACARPQDSERALLDAGVRALAEVIQQRLTWAMCLTRAAMSA